MFDRDDPQSVPDRIEGSCGIGYEVTQWVSMVTGFSSQYNTNTWAASTVVGEPDVYPRYGDIVGTWAQSAFDSNQYIDLQFPEAIQIKCLDIYETYHAGGVKRVLVRDQTGNWQPVWSTTQVQNIAESRIFSPPLQDPGFPVSHVRVEVDCSLSSSYVEIDAVQMGGFRP